MKLLKQFWRLLVGGVILILIFGGFWMYYRYQNIKSSTIADLAKPIYSIIAAVNPLTVENLKASSTDLTSTDYMYMRNQFKQFEAIYQENGVKGFYIMRKDADEIKFLIDSAEVDDPWHSEPGVIYQEPTAHDLEIFNDGKAFFEGPAIDEYGTFYSFLAPIYDPSGKIAAVMGADIDANTFDKVLIGNQELPALAIILFIILYTLMLLLVSWQLEGAFLASEKEVLEEKVRVKTEELVSTVENLKKKNEELEAYNRLISGREMKLNVIQKENKTLKEKIKKTGKRN